MVNKEEKHEFKMMKLKDIVEGFFGGYVLGFAYVILYILIKGFITWDLGLHSFDFIWKSYGLARSLIVTGVVGIMFVWGVKYEGR